MQRDELVENGTETALRQRAHALVAKSKADSVHALFAGISELPDVEPLRPAELGLVMVRGRVGGDGQRFNLGELPVARAAVRLGEGLVGIGYVAGRNTAHARMAALADAMVQSEEWRDLLEERVLAPLEAELAVRRQGDARKAAATKVDFFTMVRTREEK